MSDSFITFGDDPRWHRFTPSAWQAIAMDFVEHLPSIARLTSITSPFNQSGDPSDISPVQAFSTALQIARYGLGWTEGSRGFTKWSQIGFDGVNPHLRVISHLLGDHVQFLAEWLRHEPSGATNPLMSGGYDSFHLEGHSRGPEYGPDENACTWSSTNGNYSIVLITDSYRGWYSLLKSQKPFLDEKVLHIDLFCKPVGWLGKFNLSPTTGLWHCTTEDVHQWDRS